MMRPRAWLLFAVVVAVVVVSAGCGRRQGGQGPWQGIKTLPVGSTGLNLRVGDQIPAQGRTIRTVVVQGEIVTLDAPLPLYPGALVQGVLCIAQKTGPEFYVLLATNDPEEKVLDYYSKAWRGLRVYGSDPQRPSLLYGRRAPTVTGQSLTVRTGKMDYVPEVNVQRGPAIQPMDEQQYAQALFDKTSLSLQPGGSTMTAIQVIVPAS